MSACQITRIVVAVARTPPVIRGMSIVVLEKSEAVACEMSCCIDGAATAAVATVAISNASDPACQPNGHVTHSRAYQGRAVHARAAAITRGSNVCGAFGSGNARSLRSTNRSSSKGFTLLRLQQPAERLAAAVNICLDLAQRDAQCIRDVLVTEIFKVKQNERNPLMIGQTSKRALDLVVQL